MLAFGFATQGWAITCDKDDGTTCTINSVQNVAGQAIVLPTGLGATNLVVSGTGALNFGSTGGSITLPGDLTVAAGGQITANGSD
jgi:glucokinase